jgi:hypothetical protein
MPPIPITLRVTRSFTGIQLASTDQRIGLWGPGHGGNLSLKEGAVGGDAALLAAFDALGAVVWNTPQSTPHGGNGYYRTKTHISLQESINFLAACDYLLAGGGEEPPGPGNVPLDRGPQALPPRERLPLGLPEVAALAGDLNRIRDLFSKRNRFYRYTPGGNANWPEGRGVYVIWETQPTVETIIYIGKTGSFGRNAQGEVVYGGGTLKQRASRWHPYSFTTKGIYANHFEYGPNASVNEIKNLPEADRYQKHLPFPSVIVDCYVTDGMEHEVSPSFLEALLLQTYIRQYRSLPPANNEF